MMDSLYARLKVEGANFHLRVGDTKRIIDLIEAASYYREVHSSIETSDWEHAVCQAVADVLPK